MAPYKDAKVFLGWRGNDSEEGFPEYYFDNVPGYWKLYQRAKSLLLVGEKESERRDLAVQLENRGYTVTESWRGNEALELLKQNNCWSKLVTDNETFEKYAVDFGQWVKLNSNKPQWVVLYSYASALDERFKKLMRAANSRLGTQFLHQSCGPDKLRLVLAGLDVPELFSANPQTIVREMVGTMNLRNLQAPLHFLQESHHAASK